MTVELVGLSQWSSDGLTLTGASDTDLDIDDPETVAAVAAAAAAGSLRITHADAKAQKIIDKAVEPDAESLKVLEQAVADGTWQEGNQLAYEAQQANLLAGDEE